MLSRLAFHAGGSKSPHGPWPWAGTQQPERAQQGLESELGPDRARWLSKNQLTQLQKPRKHVGSTAEWSSMADFQAQQGLSTLRLPLAFPADRQLLPMKNSWFYMAQGSTPGFYSWVQLWKRAIPIKIPGLPLHGPGWVVPVKLIQHVSRQMRCVDRLGLGYTSTEALGQGLTTR